MTISNKQKQRAKTARFGELNTFCAAALPVLTKAEERVYIKLAQGGDNVALNYLLRSNIRFVMLEVMKRHNSGVDLRILATAGMMGLRAAILRFDLSHDVRLYSYGVWWINLFISRDLVAQAPTESKRSQKRASLDKKTKRVTHEYMCKRPQDHDVDWMLDNGEFVRDPNLTEHSKYVLLDSTVPGDEDTAVQDQLFGMPELHARHPWDEPQDAPAEMLLEIINKHPDPRIRVILINELEEEDMKRPYRELAEECKLSHERIRQLREKGLKFMSTQLRKLGAVPDWAKET